MNNIIKISSLVFAGALGSAATAAAVESEYLSVPVGGNFWANNYSFSFTLTDSDLANITDGLVLATYWGTSATHGYGSNAFYFKKDSESGYITLAVGVGALSAAPTADFKTGGSTVPTFTVSTDNNRSITTADALAAGTYSVSVVGLNGSQTVTLLKGAQTITWTNSDNIYNGNMSYNVSGNMNTAVNTSYIPEPSAFGLLAGAGALALVVARRRRKA